MVSGGLGPGRLTQKLVILNGALGAIDAHLHGHGGVGTVPTIPRLLSDHLQHLDALNHLTEDGVLIVQPVGGHLGDKELAAAGIGACVGHAEDARAVMAQLRVKLILDLIARSPSPNPLGATRLDHKLRDHTVEDKAIIKRLPRSHAHRQVNKVGYGLWGLMLEETTTDLAQAGLDLDIEVALSRNIDGSRGKEARHLKDLLWKDVLGTIGQLDFQRNPSICPEGLKLQATSLKEGLL